ncbi:MAG: hypothetical protein WA414_07110, partial [Acidobacteriaceae bacterium]
AVVPALLSAGGQQKPAPVSPVTFTLDSAAFSRNWPVSVVSVTINGRPIQFDRPVRVQGNWIRTVVVTLRNVSPKPITRGGMLLSFREAGNGTQQDPYQASWSTQGREPKIIWYAADGSYHPPAFAPTPLAPIRIPPGGLLRLSFAKDGDDVQAKIAAKNVPITKAMLSFQTFYFADDSRWSGGQYSLPPRKFPGRWTFLTKEQFFQGSKTAP